MDFSRCRTFNLDEYIEIPAEEGSRQNAETL